MMGYHCSVDGVAHYSGLVQICDLWGEVGEVYKVSCTYRCSDHCHGLQHAEVLRVDVSSDILSTSSFVRHATAPWHWLGRREREGVPTEALPSMSLMDATYTHTDINRKQSTVYVCMPLPPQTCNAIGGSENHKISDIIHTFLF